MNQKTETNEKKHFFDPNGSRIRLVMFFKKGFYNRKGEDHEVQYCLLNMNKKSDNAIIESMTKTFLWNKYRNNIKTALFVDNISGKIIKKWVDRSN